MTSRELCQKRMMSTGLERVDTIDNITEASELIKYFGLSIKGLDSLDEMKNKFREHLKELGGTSSRKIGEVCSHSNTFSVQTSQIFVQNIIIVRLYVIHFLPEKVLRQNDMSVRTGTGLFRSLQRIDEEAICVTI